MDTGQSSGGSGGGGSHDDMQHQKNLNMKYQKLAAEYAKLRSQVQVLKKAVVDEQQTSSLLRETLTSQDQTLRKLEQELDSVKFRNRQLEKRIEILQEPSPSSTSNIPSSSSSSQLDSNLLLHVEQNKQLQESLALLNEKYTTEVSRLRRKIEGEMVPKELMDSMKQEHQERTQLLNKKIKELCNQNAELMDNLSNAEMRRTTEVGGGGGGVVEPDVAGHSELLQKLSACEVEKEKLNSEVQILKMKLKRYGTNEDTSSIKSPTTSTPTAPGDSSVTTSILGKCEVIGELDNDLVQGVLRDRIDELVKLLQVSDSKAVYYYHEAFNLCRLVRTSQLSYKRLDSEFGKLKVKYRTLQDELDDITRGYEQQVNSLTEHIAILNEKLAGMVEEIGVLKRR